MNFAGKHLKFGKCVVFDEIERLAKCLQTSQSINWNVYDNRPRYLMANEQRGPWIPHFQTAKQYNFGHQKIMSQCQNLI
jgi:hypothetical protein